MVKVMRSSSVIMGPMPAPDVVSNPLVARIPGGRAVIDRQTIHVHDLAAESKPNFRQSQRRPGSVGTRTVLATPLLARELPSGRL